MPGNKRLRGAKPLSTGRPSKKPKRVRPEQVPLPDDEAGIEVDNADVEFVQEFAPSLGFLHNLNTKQLDKQVQLGLGKSKAKVANAQVDSDSDSDSPETAYERLPRHRMQEQASPKGAGLPTKDLHGQLVYAKSRSGAHAAPNVKVPSVDGITVIDDSHQASDSDAESASDSDSDLSQTDSELSEPKSRSPSAKLLQDAEPKQQQHRQLQKQQTDTKTDAELQDFQNEQERREDLKQQMAVTASKLLQNPEANLPSMRSLLILAADRDSQVARLAMLSLLAVFKDILPGYRIRPPTEKELEVSVSKEVKQTRDYESMQLKMYQAYLKLLLQALLDSKDSSAKTSAQARVAARCMCGMLSALHHFNYSSDLLQAVVPLMVHKDTQLRQLSCDAVKDVLMHDEEGKVAVEAVQLVADLIRRRRCVCSPEIVNTLLVLKLRDADPHSVSTGKKKGVKTKGKSKKARRADEVERAFKEADAKADRAVARTTQSEMLLALFEVFFRVLKQCTQSGVQAQQAQGYRLTLSTAQKRYPLLVPALAGLTKYAHLISVEYFADLLQVMQQIMHITALPLQYRLRTLLTASNILRGQGEALNIDRRELYACLYASIPELVVLPLQPDPGSLDDLLSQGDKPDPSTKNSKSSSTRAASDRSNSKSKSRQSFDEEEDTAEQPEAVLLLTVAQQMLLDQGKMLDTARLGAFTKALGCVALHSEVGAAVGVLSLVNRLLRHNMKLRSLLEHEAGAPPPAWVAASASDLTNADSAAASTPAGAPLWELALLHSHYHPHLSQAAAAVANIPSQGNGGISSSSSSILASAMDPSALASTYNTEQGMFRPAPQAPRKGPSAPAGRKLLGFAASSGKEEEQELLSSVHQQGDKAWAEYTADADMVDSELEHVLRQWFLEQKALQKNAFLHQQLMKLSRQLQVAKQQRHLSQ